MHRLTACYPRQRLLEEYPRRVFPLLHPELLGEGGPPDPDPDPPAYLWPDRRRKRSRPETRRPRATPGLAWYTEPPPTFPPTLLTPPVSRRLPLRSPRPARVDRVAPFTTAAATASVLFSRPARRRHRHSRRWDPVFRHQLAPLRTYCSDPSAAAALFVREGPAAATFVHTQSAADVQFGAATFVRSGPGSAAAWFRSRC